MSKKRDEFRENLSLSTSLNFLWMNSFKVFTSVLMVLICESKKKTETVCPIDFYLKGSNNNFSLGSDLDRGLNQGITFLFYCNRVFKWIKVSTFFSVSGNSIFQWKH